MKRVIYIPPKAPRAYKRFVQLMLDNLGVETEKSGDIIIVCCEDKEIDAFLESMSETRFLISQRVLVDLSIQREIVSRIQRLERIRKYGSN